MEIASNLSGYMSMNGYDTARSGQVSPRLAQRMAALESDALVARQNVPGEVRDPAQVRRAEAAANERASASRRDAEVESRADSSRRSGGNENNPANASTNASMPANPVFEVEFQGKHRVMKVNDSQGVLIYQVPSKGQLQLIQAEENKARMSERVEAFA